MSTENGSRLPRVVIVGGGFGGLYCARHLRRAQAEITLIDRRNFHLFQPLLYQVATGGLSPANIAAPLRGVLKRQRNTTVLMAEVADFDLARREVILAPPAGSAGASTESSGGANEAADDVAGPAAIGGERVPAVGERVPFDFLVVATGMRNSYFGNDHWSRFAPGLKSLEEATEMRRRVLLAFEAAERTHVYAERAEWLTFVVIGAGPTGLELAGTLAEIARDTLRRDFRRIHTTKARILLLDGADRVLPTYPPELSESARRQAEALGVEVWTGARVTSIDGRGIDVTVNGTPQRVNAHTVLWAAGVRASPLGAALAAQAGLQVDRMGRVPVQRDLSIAGHPNVFVIGDLALFEGPTGPLPGVAPVAMQQGAYVAKRIRAQCRTMANAGILGPQAAGRALLDQKPADAASAALSPGSAGGRFDSSDGGSSDGGSTDAPPFVYRDKGQLATIGRAAAVADIRGWHFGGYFAWLLWLLIHVFFLIQFQNRVLVMLQWAWNYFTFSRSARLIVETALTEEGKGAERE
jgi:NADH dehydrogenase